ncbi:MAG: hypothetical protein GF334_11900 [Candidatus Altiarchaeales archaeon]|nr:hypothetical protein [Candidatus Altiarchaeales archaeon]
MRLKTLALFLLFSLNCCAQLSANYNVVVEENGNALVILVVKGIGTINVPLPLDVQTPAVRGALYVQASNGVEVSIDADGSSTIMYQTALLTSREGDRWDFNMKLPSFDSASVLVSIPENTKISSTAPQAAISHVGESKNILWDVKPLEQGLVEASYSFTQTPLPQINRGGDNLVQAVALFAVVLALLVLAYVAFNLIKSQGEITLSSGKQNVLKTLTGNEVKILDTLISNQGDMKRNTLERTTQIAKSSLASSLHNLERRNIIEIDKSYTIHQIRLTEWFKNL